MLVQLKGGINAFTVEVGFTVAVDCGEDAIVTVGIAACATDVGEEVLLGVGTIVDAWVDSTVGVSVVASAIERVEVGLNDKVSGGVELLIFTFA